MEFCPECGTKNIDNSTSCKNCGEVFENVKPAKSIEKPAKTNIDEKPAKPITTNPTTSSTTTSVTSSTNVKYCGDCGAQNRRDASFCGNCGKNMNNGNRTASVQVQQTQTRSQSSSRPRYQPPNTNYQPQQNRRSVPNFAPGYIPSNFYHPKKKDVALAMLVSIFLPGIAYVYTDQVALGVVYFFLTIFLYPFVIGFFVHIYMIYAGKKQVDIYNYNLFLRVSRVH